MCHHGNVSVQRTAGIDDQFINAHVVIAHAHPQHMVNPVWEAGVAYLTVNWGYRTVRRIGGFSEIGTFRGMMVAPRVCIPRNRILRALYQVNTGMLYVSLLLVLGARRAQNNKKLTQPTGTLTDARTAP